MSLRLLTAAKCATRLMSRSLRRPMSTSMSGGSWRQNNGDDARSPPPLNERVSALAKQQREKEASEVPFQFESANADELLRIQADRLTEQARHITEPSNACE